MRNSWDFTKNLELSGWLTSHRDIPWFMGFILSPSQRCLGVWWSLMVDLQWKLPCRSMGCFFSFEGSFCLPFDGLRPEIGHPHNSLRADDAVKLCRFDSIFSGPEKHGLKGIMFIPCCWSWCVPIADHRLEVISEVIEQYSILCRILY